MRRTLLTGFLGVVAASAIQQGCSIEVPSTSAEVSAGALHANARDAASDGSTSVREARAPDTGAFDPVPPGGERSFLLATGGLQLVVAGANQGLRLTPANVATDADVFDVHQ